MELIYFISRRLELLSWPCPPKFRFVLPKGQIELSPGFYISLTKQFVWFDLIWLGAVGESSGWDSVESLSMSATVESSLPVFLQFCCISLGSAFCYTYFEGSLAALEFNLKAWFCYAKMKSHLPDMISWYPFTFSGKCTSQLRLSCMNQKLYLVLPDNQA